MQYLISERNKNCGDYLVFFLIEIVNFRNRLVRDSDGLINLSVNNDFC